MKRYNLFFPGLNPWITLGELQRCAEDYTKLFKDGKLAHPQFISHIYNLSLAHSSLTTEQIVDFYQLDIVRMKSKSKRWIQLILLEDVIIRKTQIPGENLHMNKERPEITKHR